MKTSSKKIKLYAPICLALILLVISIVLIVITFSLVYWINTKNTGDNYGMWQGCEKDGNTCGRWYGSGEALLNYQMTPSFKAFQSTQTIYLAFTFFAFVVTLVSLIFCKTRLWMFVLSGFLIFFGTSSGIASLLVFVIDVYVKTLHYLNWCYWVSLATIILNLFALLLICLFTCRLRQAPIELSSQFIKEFDSTSKTKLNTTGGAVILNENNTSVMQGIGQQPNSPKVVRILRTKELQSQPIGDSPKHTHYHSEYDLAKPPKHLKNKKYHRRFHYRQVHKLAEYKKHKSQNEQFQPGYCSEPEIIEYSLDRCWVNSNNRVPTSFETIESIDNSFDGQHYFPKTVYYDGEDRFVRQHE